MPRGRPRIPVERYINKIAAYVAIGATFEHAAAAAGVSRMTFFRWRQQMPTAKPGTPLATLREKLDEAEGKAAIHFLKQLEQAAKEGNWQAAAWRLERRWPESYGRTIQRQEHTTPEGQDAVAGAVVIIALPSKAPTLDAWADEVRQLAPPAAQNGHAEAAL